MGIGGGSVLVPWRPAFWNDAEVVILDLASGGKREGSKKTMDPREEQQKVRAQLALEMLPKIRATFHLCSSLVLSPYAHRRSSSGSPRLSADLLRSLRI